MTYYDPSQATISDRLEAGFLSDTPLGKKQKFFAWYSANKDYESFDGHEAQRLEQEAGVTQTDWDAYRNSFEIQF